MVAWAFRYLVVVVLVATTFALANRDRLLGPELGRASGGVEARGPVREIWVPADDRGHFFLRATVHGSSIAFLVDTGASTIVLSPEDARRTGFRLANLDFDQRIVTAGGLVPGASVTLREIRIGQLQVFDVPATVHGAPLPISLLGTSFLRRLEGYEVDNDRLILRW